MTRRRLVDADARGVAESRAVSTLLRVTEARYLVVDVTLAEIAFAVPQERPTCKGTYLSSSHNVNKEIALQFRNL